MGGNISGVSPGAIWVGFWSRHSSTRTPLLSTRVTRLVMDSPDAHTLTRETTCLPSMGMRTSTISVSSGSVASG